MPNTKQQCFAAYWGASVLTGDNAKPSGRILGLKEHSVLVGTNSIGVDLWYKLSCCTLVLKDLSNITEKDAREVGILLGCHLMELTNSIAIELQKEWQADASRSYIMCNKSYEKMYTKVTDFLRSRHYCLPFAGKDIVKEGWAVIEPTKK